MYENCRPSFEDGHQTDNELAYLSVGGKGGIRSEQVLAGDGGGKWRYIRVDAVLNIQQKHAFCTFFL